MLEAAVSIEKPIARLVNIDSTPRNEIANLLPPRSRLGDRTLPHGYTDRSLVSVVDCQDEAIRKSAIEVNRNLFRLPWRNVGLIGVTVTREEAHGRVVFRG